jgi:hypothetical protein
MPPHHLSPETADYSDNQDRISILKIRFILSKFRAAPQSKRAQRWHSWVEDSCSGSRVRQSDGLVPWRAGCGISKCFSKCRRRHVRQPDGLVSPRRPSLPLQKTKSVDVSRVSSGRSRLRGHGQSKKGSAVSRGALMLGINFYASVIMALRLQTRTGTVSPARSSGCY